MGGGEVWWVEGRLVGGGEVWWVVGRFGGLRGV